MAPASAQECLTHSNCAHRSDWLQPTLRRRAGIGALCAVVLGVRGAWSQLVSLSGEPGATCVRMCHAPAALHLLQRQ